MRSPHRGNFELRSICVKVRGAALDPYQREYFGCTAFYHVPDLIWAQLSRTSTIQIRVWRAAQHRCAKVRSAILDLETRRDLARVDAPLGQHVV